MAKKGIQQRKRLAAIFASFSILIVGACSLLENMTLDYYSVLDTVEKVFPAAIILGGIGWIMGMILDKPKKNNKISYNNLFLNDVMKSRGAEGGTASSEKDVAPD